MPLPSATWQPDLLDGYENVTVHLHPDDEGPVITTVIRPVSIPAEPRFLMLALHGWNDYFFQEPLAEAMTELDGAFYAIDLRKYGRSHLDGQSWGYVTDLSVYDDDIHAALDVMRSEHGTDLPLLLYGHSTGGLTASLWAHRHPGVLAGLVLNAPWLEFQAPTAVREAGTPIVEVAARTSPNTEITLPDPGYYTKSLERWSPDPRFRQTPSFPIRAGWLRAIIDGHKRVADGLNIDCPILVLTSDHWVVPTTWSEELMRADMIIDLGQVWKRVPGLGRHTTLIKIEGAIHDVTLSSDVPRKVALAEMASWIETYPLRD